MDIKGMLITHKPTRQPQKGDIVIQVTDMSLHTKEFVPTPSVGKKIVKALGKNEATRVYVPTSGDLEKDKLTIQDKVQNDPELMKLVQETNAHGGKVFFSFPKGGTPTQFGKDTQAFIESKNGKRLLRGLAKQDNQDKI